MSHAFRAGKKILRCSLLKACGHATSEEGGMADGTMVFGYRGWCVGAGWWLGVVLMDGPVGMTSHQQCGMNKTHIHLNLLLTQDARTHTRTTTSLKSKLTQSSVNCRVQPNHLKAASCLEVVSKCAYTLDLDS